MQLALEHDLQKMVFSFKGETIFLCQIFMQLSKMLQQLIKIVKTNSNNSKLQDECHVLP